MSRRGFHPQLQEWFWGDLSFQRGTIEDLLLSKGILVNSEVDENLKLKTLISGILAPSDLKLILSITERCNFLCKYCYESHNKLDISEDIKHKIIDYVRYNIHRFTSLNITWFGGEPLLGLDNIREMSQELMKICTFNHRNYTASMTTNGYLLNIDTFKELLKYRVWAYQITLDGLRDNHDMQRPTVTGGPTFDRVVDNLWAIKKLKSRNFHIVIRSNLTKDIFNHMDEYVEFLCDLCGDDNRFSLSICYASNWSENIDTDFKDSFIEDRKTVFPLYEKFLKCKKKINFAFLLNPEDGACELGRSNRFFIRPNGELHKCSIHFENSQNIVGRLNNHQIELKDIYYQKIINPAKCENLESCFYAPICKGEGCPAIRTASSSICPDTKYHLDYVLRLLDKAGQTTCIDA